MRLEEPCCRHAKRHAAMLQLLHNRVDDRVVTEGLHPFVTHSLLLCHRLQPPPLLHDRHVPTLYKHLLSLIESQMSLVATTARPWEDDASHLTAYHYYRGGRKADHHSGADTDDPINVFLRMWDGKTLCCVMNADQQASVVSCLEQKVFDCYPGYERRNFFMEHQGKPLTSSSTSLLLSSSSSSTASKCQLTNNAYVFVHYRNRGGCFMISFTILMTIFMLIIGSTCTCGTSLLLIPLLLPFLFVLPLFCL